jgi:hypothetical protein
VFSSNRARYLLAAALLATAACGGNRAVPMTGPGVDASAAMRNPEATVDTTSVLKTLVKNVTIGSTIDAKNGDKTPHGLVVAANTYGAGSKIKKGDLIACNYANKTGLAGQGTTIEILTPKAGSKPVTFAQNTGIKGCTALGITAGESVWGASSTGKAVSVFDATGKIDKLTNAAFVTPFGATYAPAKGFYPQLITFVSDATTGTLVKINATNPPQYQYTVIATGFAVNKKAGLAALAPSGLVYDQKIDTLYIIDGTNNTVVAFKTATAIQLTDAVAVQPGGKTFKYAKKQGPIASLVYSGTALKSPVAAALLPNGNLIIANTVGNALVEMTPTGKILATKVVDTKTAAAIFGLVATGTSDANTVLYYTDANTNTLHQLSK